MDRSLFGFIIRYSKRDQLLIVPLVLATMVVYYLVARPAQDHHQQGDPGRRLPDAGGAPPTGSACDLDRLAIPARADASSSSA